MAEYVGGTEAQFIEMMNEKARELGCRNTHFANASGLPDSNHYTTAYDLAKIMRAGLPNPPVPESYQRSQLYDSGYKPQRGKRNAYSYASYGKKNPIFIMKAALAEKQEIPMTQAIPL